MYRVQKWYLIGCLVSGMVQAASAGAGLRPSVGMRLLPHSSALTQDDAENFLNQLGRTGDERVAKLIVLTSPSYPHQEDSSAVDVESNTGKSTSDEDNSFEEQGSGDPASTRVHHKRVEGQGQHVLVQHVAAPVSNGMVRSRTA